MVTEEKIQRRMRRRIQDRRLRDRKAVSPVVATLLLILIAVAAAAALYLFVTSFQTSTQKTVGTPGTQATLTLGGSNAVYPISQQAVAWFEQNNTNIQIQNNQGGSGAGLLALCAGNIQLAAMSRPVLPSDPTNCANQAVQTTLGYEVDAAVLPKANANGIVSLSSQEALMAYWLNGGQPSLATASGSNPVVGCDSSAGSGIGAACLAAASGVVPAKAGSIISGTTAQEYVPAYWGIQQPSDLTGTGCSGSGNLGCLEWSNVPQQACYDPNLVAETGGAQVDPTGTWYQPSASALASVSIPAGGGNQQGAYDTLNGLVYVPALGSGIGELLAINPATNLVVGTYSLGFSVTPYVALFDPAASGAPDGMILVTQAGFGPGAPILTFNPSTNTLGSSISVGSGDGDVEMAYDSTLQEVFATSGTNGNVDVISGVSLSLTTTFSMGMSSQPSGIAYDPTTTTLYVDTGSGVSSSLISVNPSTYAIITGVGVGNQPFGLTYDNVNGNLYVDYASQTSPYPGGVDVVNPTSMTVTANVGLGDGSNPLVSAVDPTTGDVYVGLSGWTGSTNNGTSVAVISGATSHVTAIRPVGTAPYGLVFAPSDGAFYVSNFNSFNVTALYPGAAPYSGPCAAAWSTDGASASAIHVYGSSVASGTEETLSYNMLGLSCGSDLQLSSCGFPYNSGTATAGQVNVASSDKALITAEEGDPNALGFASYGLTIVSASVGGGGATSSGTTSSCGSGSGLCMLAFVGAGAVPVAGTNGAVSSGTSSTSLALVPSGSDVLSGINTGFAKDAAGAYPGWRPLEYVTQGPPSGEAAAFLEFVQQPYVIAQLMGYAYDIPYTSE